MSDRTNANHIVLFFQAEDGIRDYKVTGVQTCALPISALDREVAAQVVDLQFVAGSRQVNVGGAARAIAERSEVSSSLVGGAEIGRASCRERMLMPAEDQSYRNDSELNWEISETEIVKR